MNITESAKAVTSLLEALKRPVGTRGAPARELRAPVGFAFYGAP